MGKVYEAMDVGMGFSGRPGFGILLALLSAVGATAAFSFAAFLRPQPMSFLPPGAVNAFVHRHGILLAAHALAFLFGAIMWVTRYDVIAEKVWGWEI